MSPKILQEAICDHAHLTSLTELDPTPEASALFQQYQAAHINRSAIKRCLYNGQNKPETILPKGVTMTTAEALDEHGQVRKASLILCGHGIVGLCAAIQGPSQNNEHVGHESEQW